MAEHLSVGVLGARYSLGEVRAVVAASGKESERVRLLPAEVTTYYVIALGLLMSVSTSEVLRVLREGLAWLGGEDSGRVASKAAIAQARARLGVEPLRLLWERTAEPLAQPGSAGAFHRELRLVALDGTTLDVPDTAANRSHFGKPGASRGESAFPQLRMVGLLETGSHGFFAFAHGPCKSGEQTLAGRVVPSLKKACSAWRIATSPPTPFGNKLPPRGLICCGVAVTNWCCRWRSRCPTGPTCPRFIRRPRHAVTRPTASGCE